MPNIGIHEMTKGARIKLDKVQRLALVAMTQPLRSTPNGFRGHYGMVTFGHTLSRSGHAYLLKNKRHGWDGIGQQKGIKGHLGVWRAMEEKAIGIAYPREAHRHEQIWVEQCTCIVLPISVHVCARRLKRWNMN